MEKSVTIICPIRNEEKFIADCLKALVEQTYDRNKTEILVIDGMSDDGTRDIVAEFQRKYHNVRLLDNPARIVPKALNIGIRAASGKYILRMDGHAKAAPDYVEACVAALENGEAAGVGGPIESVNTTDTGKAIALAMSSPFGVGNSRFRTSTEEGFVDSVAFTAYTADVFEKYGNFDEELVRCQDDEYNFRVRKLGGKILLTPKIRSLYFPRASLKKLWRQYFGYGFWKIRVFQKHPLMMQPRHFVPAAFVTFLTISLILGILIDGLSWIFTSVALFYICCAALAAFAVWRQNKETSAAKILASFFILHFSYGMGFLWGLMKFAPRWFKKREVLVQPGSV